MANVYEINPELTGVSLAYRNQEYIADEFFKPVKTSTQSFKYRVYEKDLNLQLPNTAVGETGDPNKIEFKSRLVTDSVEGHSLYDELSQVEIDDAQANGINKEAQITEFLTDVFGACREARLATMLSDTANYGNNHKTLQSSEKINVDTANATKLIQGAIDSMWMPANTMIISRLAFSALRQNPFIVKAVNKNSGDSGIASLEGIKDLFQLDRILVGKSMANTAKRNQTASYVNIWGNDIILAYINPNATLDNGVTFGLKAERGEREISTGFDAKRGVRGVEYIKIANEEKDLIVCPDCGYLLKGVI